VDKLYKVIFKALDAACPLTDEIKLNKNNPWFKGKLKEMRKEVIKYHKSNNQHRAETQTTKGP